MNREELLSEWARRAPGECEIQKRSPGLGKPRISFQVKPFEGWYLHGHVVANAMILSALIEAIRARGWHYVLHSLAEDAAEGPKQWSVATILTAPNWSEAEYEGREVEPCDALLQAYVTAIQAAEEDKVETKP